MNLRVSASWLRAMDLIHKGATMIIMSSDFNIWNASVRSIREEIEKVLKEQMPK